VMADPSFTAIQLVVVATLSQKLGWQFYEGLHKNDTMIVQGHEQIFDMIKRGERLVSAEASDPRIYTGGTMPDNMINIIPAEGAIQVPSPTAIVKGSPHPNAAKLFLDWALSREGQALMVELGSFSSLREAPLPPGVDAAAIKTWYPDDAEVEKVFKPWTDDWNKAYNYRQ